MKMFFFAPKKALKKEATTVKIIIAHVTMEFTSPFLWHMTSIIIHLGRTGVYRAILLLQIHRLTARSGLTVLSNHSCYSLLHITAGCHRASFCLAKQFFLTSVVPYARMTLNQSGCAWRAVNRNLTGEDGWVASPPLSLFTAKVTWSILTSIRVLLNQLGSSMANTVGLKYHWFAECAVSNGKSFITELGVQHFGITASFLKWCSRIKMLWNETIWVLRSSFRCSEVHSVSLLDSILTLPV